MANEKEQLPVWISPGIEPPQSLKENGWQAGVKPPAQYMDWFFNRTYMVLKQLQEGGGASELVGDLTQLSTQDKTNIVRALNEMNTKKVNTSDKATLTDAEVGTNDTKWMTPLKTMESILSLFESLLANQTDAVAGTANDKIMTPLRVNNVTGTLSALQTTNKTNIVQAVNEVKAEVTQHKEQSASTSTKGHVQLSNDTNSVSETLAPTMKALNEVKLLANDIKTKVSNVVGSPLTSTDTSDQMVTKIQTIKNTLANNLSAKGQASTDSESLTILAGKVANISTGRKFASGSVASSSTTASFTYYSLGSARSSSFAEVAGLTFLPSAIEIIAQNGDTYYKTSYVKNSAGFVESITVISVTTTSSSSPVYHYKNNVNSAYVNSTGFKLPLYLQGLGYTWFAYE